jgi:hypothetical protein
MLRRTKREKVTGGWRELHNGEFHNVISSPSVIVMFMSKKIRKAGPRIGGWIILKWFVVRSEWCGLIWLKIWTGGGRV